MTELDFSFSKASELTGISQPPIADIVAGLPDDTSVEELVAAFVAIVRAEKASAIQPDVTLKPGGLFSILELAKMAGTYPEAVKKVLKGIKPVVSKTKLKQYRLTQKNAAGKTVQELIDSIQEDPKLSDVKTRAAMADAELREIKVLKARRELIPYAEVRDELQRVFHHLYQLLVVKQPRDLADRIVMCKNSREATALLKRESSKAFDDLRTNYKRLFGSS